MARRDDDTTSPPRFSGPTNAAGFAQGVQFAAAAAHKAENLEELRQQLDGLAEDAATLLQRIDDAERAVLARYRSGGVP